MIFLILIISCFSNSCMNSTDETKIDKNNGVEKINSNNVNESNNLYTTNELSIEEINQGILNRYIDGEFELGKYSEIKYHENGVIRELNLCSKNTNNDICIYKGTQHKKRISFFDNGQLRNVAEYKNNRLHNEQIDYWKNGVIQHKRNYLNGIQEGEEIQYWEDGSVRSKRNYLNDKTEGLWLTYHLNGKLSMKSEYRNGEAIYKTTFYENGQIEDDFKIVENEYKIYKSYFESGILKSETKIYLNTGNKSQSVYNEDGKIKSQEYYDKNGNQIENLSEELKPFENTDSQIYTISDQSAEFPGGFDGISKYVAVNFDENIAAEIAGRIIVRFVVEKDGSISNVEVIKSLSNESSKEAIRVIKSMPKWKPGKNNGKAIRLQFTLPLNFG
jgi:TonB family protein